jgi:hypothetical protein
VRQLIAEDGATLVQVTLEPVPAPVETATVDIDSTPPGAQIVLAGKTIGTAPLRGVVIPTGQALVLHASAPGHRPLERSLQPRSGEHLRLDLKLEAEGGRVTTLDLDTTPPGMLIFLDDQRIGTTPIRGHRLAPGAHVIKLRDPATGIEVSKAIRASAGERVQRSIDMPLPRLPDHGTLRIDVRTNGTRVSIDGTAVGTTPLLPQKVAPGVHRVRLQNAQLDKDITLPVKIEAGKEFVITQSW